MKFSLQKATIYNSSLSISLDEKLLINTINAHSYNVAQNDIDFQSALYASDILLPDGVSIVWAIKMLKKEKINRITGADLFFYEINKLNSISGSCFFLGSNDDTLHKILQKASVEYPNVRIDCYSPPYKTAFSEEDTTQMIQAVNNFQPDVLFIGMTAPKQEKWAHAHLQQLNTKHICSIGAVFDFYAGNIKRAPKWMQDLGLEWLFRLIYEPKRMWKRYLIGNILFIFNILKEILP